MDLVVTRFQVDLQLIFEVLLKTSLSAILTTIINFTITSRYTMCHSAAAGHRDISSLVSIVPSLADKRMQSSPALPTFIYLLLFLSFVSSPGCPIRDPEKGKWRERKENSAAIYRIISDRQKAPKWQNLCVGLLLAFPFLPTTTTTTIIILG